MRHQYRTLFLVFTAVFFLTGCNSWQYFELILNVQNKEDSKPVVGVTAKLATFSTYGDKLDPNYGLSAGTTDAEGKLQHNFMVSPYPSSDPWYLVLTKEGFEPVILDIKPEQQPKSKGKDQIPLNVTVEMKPSRK